MVKIFSTIGINDKYTYFNALTVTTLEVDDAGNHDDSTDIRSWTPFLDKVSPSADPAMRAATTAAV